LFIGFRGGGVLSAAHSLLVFCAGTTRLIIIYIFGGASVLASRLVSSLAPPNCTLPLISVPYYRLFGLAAARHAGGICGASLNGFGTGDHLVAFHDGIHVVRHAGNGGGLIAESAGRDGLSRGGGLGRRNTGGDYDLVAGGAWREQRVTGIDAEGDRGQGGCADCHKEDSSFHVYILSFWEALCFAPPIGCIWLTPAHGKSRKTFFEGFFEGWCIIDVVILDIIMKTLKMLGILALTVPFIALPLAGVAADTNSAAATPPKPDKLTTCPVSGEKLGGDMGKPYVFVYQGQEVKLCCSGCKKDFDKDPAKYIKKIQDAAAAQK
jgi:YHS domain-containing protein